MAALVDVGKPLAFGALVLLAEAGTRWLSHWAGGYKGAPSTPYEPADGASSKGVPLELKFYEELVIFAQDGTRTSRLFGRRRVFGPSSGEG